MVYVQGINGKPMMPTTRHGKVRRLLKDKKAVVVNLCPFTIRLTYVTSDYKQEIVLGVDAGTKHVGLSATTKSKELYSSEVILRNDIVDLLSTRRELRRTRRNRLRYRKPRFDNRIKSKRPGWVAPSVKYKIDAHIRVIDNVCSILPISRIVIEVAQFDTQKIKNPEIGKKRPYQPTNIPSGTVFCGLRHPSILSQLAAYGIAHKNCSVQGFLTSKNQFLTREEASELVKSNNQEMVVDRSAIREQLYSEDLY